MSNSPFSETNEVYFYQNSLSTGISLLRDVSIWKQWILHNVACDHLHGLATPPPVARIELMRRGSNLSN